MFQNCTCIAAITEARTTAIKCLPTLLTEVAVIKPFLCFPEVPETFLMEARLPLEKLPERLKSRANFSCFVLGLSGVPDVIRTGRNLTVGEESGELSMLCILKSGSDSPMETMLLPSDCWVRGAIGKDSSRRVYTKTNSETPEPNFCWASNDTNTEKERGQSRTVFLWNICSADISLLGNINCV